MKNALKLVWLETLLMFRIDATIANRIAELDNVAVRILESITFCVGFICDMAMLPIYMVRIFAANIRSGERAKSYEERKGELEEECKNALKDVLSRFEETE